MNHEKDFVLGFVIPEKRMRYIEFLQKPKRRIEIIRRFNHAFDFVASLATKFPREQLSQLSAQLRGYGANSLVYVIGGRDLDGKEMPLDDAIERAINEPGGVVISCIPGRLALCIQEFPPGDIYILRT